MVDGADVDGRAVLGTVMVVVAVLVLAVTLTILTGPGRGGLVPPDETPDGPPTRAAEQEWETLRPRWGVESMQPNAVDAHDSTFVVVADVDSLTTGLGTPIWWSDDGRTWTRASGLRSANVSDLDQVGDGFVATGIDDDGAAAFRSDDGRTWEQTLDLPRQSSVDALWGVTDSARGPFVWGLVGGSPVLYRSDDGRQWESAALPTPAGRDRETRLCAVADAAGGLLVATGGVQVGGSEKRIEWSSSNGTTWRLVGVTDDDATTVCNDFAEPHWSATTDAGSVRVEPFGEPGLIYYLPPEG